MKEERITITLANLGSITATKDAFNELAITFYYAKKQYKMEECFGLAKNAEKISATIHSELEKRGYYIK